MTQTLNKEELDNVNLIDIKSAYTGDSFHGEVWVRCPHCGYGHEMMETCGCPRKDGFIVVKCSKCGKLFKDR